MKNRARQGSTLIIAVVLTMVFLSITIAVSNFVLNDIELSQAAKESSYALYAADTGLECALYYDLNRNLFFNALEGTEFIDNLQIDCGEGNVDVEAGAYVNCNWPAGYDGCFQFETAVDVGSGGQTYYTEVDYLYDLDGYVTIRSRGYNNVGGNDNQLQRALEYTYDFYVPGGPVVE